MMEHLTLSAADFRSYIAVRVILGQSATSIISELRSASPSSAPLKATVFRWVKHFQSGKSSILARRGKVKNNKKCNEELAARVKAMVDEDARSSLEEIASALNCSSGSSSSILRDRLGYHKVRARWIPHNMLAPQQKRDRVAYSTALLKMSEHCDPRHLYEMMTGDKTWQYNFEPTFNYNYSPVGC